jgi:predicted AAA+ superfamily ATPase
MRFFNTAGPVNCVKHYYLDPLSRFDLEEILSLIRQEKYFVLHAPRQTGKTSCMLALMKYLNDTGEYLSLYTNIESAQVAREDVTSGIRSVMSSIGIYARDFFRQSVCP